MCTYIIACNYIFLLVTNILSDALPVKPKTEVQSGKKDGKEVPPDKEKPEK